MKAKKERKKKGPSRPADKTLRKFPPLPQDNSVREGYSFVCSIAFFLFFFFFFLNAKGGGNHPVSLMVL